MADVVGLATSVAGLIQTLLDYVGAVKNAKDDIRRLSLQLFALNGTLDHFSKCRTTAVRGLPWRGQFDNMVDMTRKTVLLIEEKLRAKDTGFGQAMRSLSWPFQKADVDKLVDSLEKSKTWFIMVLLQDTTEVTSSLFNEMKQLSSLVQEGISMSNQETLHWLAPVNSSREYDKARQFRVPGTGTWFLDKAFEAWADGSSHPPFLWITGTSGSGKTTLFATLVDEVKKRCHHDAHKTGYGFHFCSLDNDESRKPTNIFGAMLAQLARMRPDVMEEIRAQSRSQDNPMEERSLTLFQIRDMIRGSVGRVGRFFILIDALNETRHHQNTIVDILLSLCRWLPNLRLLATCTANPTLPSHDKALVAVRNMVVHAVDRDIETYVQHRLVKDEGLVSLDSDVLHCIKRKVTASAHGSFRWAQLCLDRLSRLRTKGGVIRALEDLPATLNETYLSILDGISSSGYEPESDQRLARDALMWLSFAAQPLTLGQLAEAVMLDESDRRLNKQGLKNEHDLVDICGGLVHVNDAGHATLAHDSIRSFLTSDWLKSSPAAATAAHFALHGNACHSTLMRKCLTYLSFEKFAAGPVDTMADLDDRLHRHKLLSYACFNWPAHAASCLSTNPREIDMARVLAFFAERRGSFASWVQLLLQEVRHEAIFATEPLYYVASFNLLPVLRLFLRPGSKVDLNRPGGRNMSTPLANACFRGNEEASLLLLEAGADPSDRRNEAYRFAKDWNMTEVVQQMEARGVMAQHRRR